MSVRHPFISDGKYYVYDAVSAEVLELSGNIFGFLPAWEKHNQKKSQGKNKDIDLSRENDHFRAFHSAVMDGLFSSDLPVLVNPLEEPHVLERLNSSVSTITLCLTEICNLRCKYCTYTENTGSRRTHGTTNMSLQIVQKALNFYTNSSNLEEPPYISFYGGEPLTNFSLLKEIVQLAKQIFAPKPVDFAMTTNGLNINKQIANFLAENGFILTVSLDGPKGIHDRYRINQRGRGTFNKVIKGLLLLQETAPKYFSEKVKINMVLAPPLDLEAINDFLKDKCPVSTNRCSASLVDGSDTNFFKLYPYTENDSQKTHALRRRAEECFISGNWDTHPLARLMFKNGIIGVALRDRKNMSNSPFIPTGQCLPGGAKLFVDARGLFHICERIDETVSIGSIDTGIDIHAIRKIFDPYYQDAMKTCRTCWGQRLCGICVADTIKDGSFDKETKTQACKDALSLLENNLISYVRILAKNPNAFHHSIPLVSQKSFVDIIDIQEPGQVT